MFITSVHRFFIVFFFFIGIFFSFSVHAETNIDSLYERVRGRMILEAEKNGAAYYVSPTAKKMFPLGRPSEAFALMKKIGIGISNANLEKIPVSESSGDISFSSRHKGKIFLQVESKGEAWYVNPTDAKRHFLGRPHDAFELMKKLSLGVSNKNFSELASLKRTLIAQALPELQLPRFHSCDELRSVLKPFQRKTGNFFGLEYSTGMIAPTSVAGSNSDFSGTNVQVEGVDEADMVKTDGKYIYTITGQTLFIVNTQKGLQKEAVIEFDKNDFPKEMFIAPGRILVIGYRSGKTFVQIYDTLVPSSPTLARDVEFDSSYISSRLIGNYAYIVMNQSLWSFEEDDPIIPMYKENTSITNEKQPLVGCTDVEKINPIVSSRFLMIVSFPLEDMSGAIEKEVFLGAGEDVYASPWNLYTAKQKYDNASETTSIEKFSLDNGEIRHVASAEVEGRILNQFSMDEYDEYFRIATTIGHVSQSGNITDNRIYVLDTSLQVTGKIVEIAPGEQIYSARFMGEKGYLVTFKKVDPFFTLDLSDPTAPKVAGKLKIPGFSDYLHPVDENHILGLGKDTVEADEGNFAWYQGLKMAIFDVTDFQNPKELHRIIIGDRGTDSVALKDHKAFLFSNAKKLLALPIQLVEIDSEKKNSSDVQANTYGETVFDGAFVFETTIENGFKELARITHYDSDEALLKSGNNFYRNTSSIQRSLYIGNMLYTISSEKIQAHSLADFSKQGELDLSV